MTAWSKRGGGHCTGALPRRSASWHPPEAEANPQLIATHFTEAGETAAAIGWWQAAGLRSLQQSAVTEGLDQLDMALTLLASC